MIVVKIYNNQQASKSFDVFFCFKSNLSYNYVPGPFCSVLRHKSDVLLKFIFSPGLTLTTPSSKPSISRIFRQQ